MKKILLVTLFYCSVATVYGQINVGKVVNQARSVVSAPSSAEIGLGIKEALQAGVISGTEKLSMANGFMGNASVKLLFPPEALKVEKTLRGIGAGSLCDDLILSLNRAAEDAAKEAKPIFLNAIKNMSIADASSLLLSTDKDAATRYFKSATEKELAAKFNPIITANLEKTGATKYWGDVAATYNKVPFVTKINADIADYATQKAVAGVFTQIALEELKLRTSVGARNTPLLQKVFAFADAKNK